jgi:hypothetical protein
MAIFVSSHNLRERAWHSDVYHKGQGMKSEQLLSFRQCADILRTEKFISIETLSGYSMIRPEDQCQAVYLEPDATEDALGRALLQALDKSRFIWPRDDPAFFDTDHYTKAYQNSHKNFMRRYRYKTKRDAYRNLDWCRTIRTEGRITIEPHKRDKPGTWKSLPLESRVSFPETNDATVAGTALRLALTRCE